MKELFQAFFASIPYQWYTNNHIADYEGYYASVFFSYFAALGYEITVEESSSHGRLDMAVRAGGRVYLFDAGRPVVRHASTAVRRRAGWANGQQRRSTPGTVAGDDVDRRCDWWSRLVGA